MRLIIDKESFKVFSKAMLASTKLGEDIFFECKNNCFTIKAVNDTRSLFFFSKFERNFFEEYQAPELIECKFKAKSCIIPFKSNINLEKNLSSLEFFVDKGKDSATFQMNFDNNDDISMHEINYINTNLTVDLEEDIELDNYLMSKIKTFVNLFNHFPNQNDYCVITVDEDKISFETYNFKMNEVRTAFSIRSDSFLEYKINTKIRSTFILKPMKTFLNSLDRNANCYFYFEDDNCPINVLIKANSVEHKFIIASIDVDIDSLNEATSVQLNTREINPADLNRDDSPNSILTNEENMSPLSNSSESYSFRKSQQSAIKNSTNNSLRPLPKIKEERDKTLDNNSNLSNDNSAEDENNLDEDNLDEDNLNRQNLTNNDNQMNDSQLMFDCEVSIDIDFNDRTNQEKLNNSKQSNINQTSQQLIKNDLLQKNKSQEKLLNIDKSQEIQSKSQENQSKISSQVNSQIDSQVNLQVNSQIDSQVNLQVNSQIDSQIPIISANQTLNNEEENLDATIQNNRSIIQSNELNLIIPSTVKSSFNQSKIFSNNTINCENVQQSNLNSEINSNITAIQTETSSDHLNNETHLEFNKTTTTSNLLKSSSNQHSTQAKENNNTEMKSFSSSRIEQNNDYVLTVESLKDLDDNQLMDLDEDIDDCNNRSLVNKLIKRKNLYNDFLDKMPIIKKNIINKNNEEELFNKFMDKHRNLLR